ncbi:MFS transporter [Umezawaea tangerina]|uniref:DHA2 family methylenomycin A resistance protein-like MFS transporter n=1 Tax=Umezawaea tangerina TaxID=84725 RepID=A0A2T0SKQ2_9PSEU|nr:MFS transporter [Umezawaea tangerina]PRY33991.1 DHA2 family methylenomycin A resistance protein-like MFS transporter [Umezawaea tangerina]
MTSSAATTTRGPGALLLLGLSLGYFLVLLDTTVITVALPAVGADLGGGLGALQWVSNGYPLAFAALLLTAGAWSDRHGARRVFLVGLCAFAVLSAATSVAWSVGVLIGLRALLGVAGALLVPTSLALVATAWTEPAARARATGVWAALSGTGLVAGPVAGGLLTDAFGWRSVFLVNVPVALAAVVVVARRAPETPRSSGRGTDVTGQVSAVVALGALTYGLVRARWSAPDVLGALAVAVLAAVVFVLAQRRPETGPVAPMLPPRLFADRTFGWGLAAGAIVNFGLSGVLFVLSLSWQGTRGYSASAAGLAFLPLTIPTALNPVLTGRLVARTGPKVPAVAGFLLMAAGTAAQAATTDPLLAALGLALLGFGVSFAIPSLMTAVLGAVPKDLAGVGGGAVNAARQTGAVLGVAVLGTLLPAGPRTALATAAAVLVVGAVIAGAAVE